MDSKRRRKLRALAKLMVNQSEMIVPVTNDVVDCFELIISPEEADFMFKMGSQSYTYERLLPYADMSEEKFKKFFESMIKKGLIRSLGKIDDKEQFVLPPLMLGWFEIQLNKGQVTDETKEFARRVEKAQRNFTQFNRFPLRNMYNFMLKRSKFFKAQQTVATIIYPKETGKKIVIDINQDIHALSKIYPTEKVYKLVEKYGDDNKIGVWNCFCRTKRGLTNNPCRFHIPYETCIILGSFAEYIVEYGFGRYISKGEALDILLEARKKGAVHSVFHEEENIDLPEMTICNCCWDCCGILGLYNRGIGPLQYKTYYIAQIHDNSLCVGCNRLCEKYCPVNAHSLVNGVAVIHTKKCIGCGQCYFQCPRDAVKLNNKERVVVVPLQKISEARLRP
jgi:Pyruvate/2-oxoacid:ferredoxin oxidoreductase delta subunit